ncbi:MAG: fibronectin type III domain-containing protein, partial [Steroidobacteraceae bacterium]
TAYRYRVRARDAVPNYSGYSSIVSATTGDSTGPSAPATLSATAASDTQISLSWVASTDNVAVTGYLVESCQGATCTDFAQIATPTSATYSNTGLTGSTTYRYRVRASDAVPNFSSYSAIASATTQPGAAPPDSQAPTVPTGLTITAGANQLALSWNASTDNVAVTAYLIERCGGAGCVYAEIASVPATTYTDTTVSAATDYSYRVRARDAANNRSGYSSAVMAMPADCD